MINIKFLSKIIRRKVYLLYLSIYPLNHKKVEEHTNPRDEIIVVSLTSYPARLDRLHLTIKSIFRQTCAADRIILYLGEDCNSSELPKNLLRLKKHGLEIVYVEGNLGPHKKYYYSVKDYPDAFVLTIDDDTVYPSNLIESFIEEHRRNKGCVVCSRAHLMRVGEDKKLLPYLNWKWEHNDYSLPSFAVFPTGCGGVLYPPGVFNGTKLLDKMMISTICRNNDDIWLKWNYSGNGVKAVIAPGNLWHKTYDIYINDLGLNVSNIDGGENDRVIRELESTNIWEKEMEDLMQ